CVSSPGRGARISSAPGRLRHPRYRSSGRPPRYNDRVLADRSTLIPEIVARTVALVAAATCTWLWLTGPTSPDVAFTPRALVIGLAIGAFVACAWMPERMDENIRRSGASGLIRGFGFVGLVMLAGVLYAISSR